MLISDHSTRTASRFVMIFCRLQFLSYAPPAVPCHSTSTKRQMQPPGSERMKPLPSSPYDDNENGQMRNNVQSHVQRVPREGGKEI